MIGKNTYYNYSVMVESISTAKYDAFTLDVYFVDFIFIFQKIEKQKEKPCIIAFELFY